MATKITYDINAGGLNCSLGTNGKNFDIVHQVSGVTGANAGEKLDNAIQALLDDGFSIGDDIAEATGSWLREMKARPAGGNKPARDIFWVTLTYRTNPREELKIDSSSSLVQKNVTEDVFGVPIEVSYTYPDVYKPNTAVQGSVVTQGKLTPKLIPQLVLTFRIRQFEVDPAVPAAIYVGKVNSSNWYYGAPGEWMCMDISGYSDDSGDSFDNAYTFQKNTDNWNGGFKVVFIDDKSKQPPPDVGGSDQPDSVIYPDLYLTENFNTLFNFPFGPA